MATRKDQHKVGTPPETARTADRVLQVILIRIARRRRKLRRCVAVARRQTRCSPMLPSNTLPSNPATPSTNTRQSTVDER